MDASRLTQETAELLSALIRFDTTNPPGNELACAEFLAGWLRERRVPAEVIESTPGRGNVSARLAGSRDEKPLLLMGHLDVVPAGNLGAWKHDPFGGEITDGCVWGRGAVDCKGIVAAEAVVLAELARCGETAGRPVSFLAPADEEVGGAEGIGWLIGHAPDKADCWGCVTEGGGDVYRVGDHGFTTVMTGEKGQLRVRFTLHGFQGHAAMPVADQAMYHLGELLRRLEQHEPAYRLLPGNRALLDNLVAAMPDGAKLAAALEAGVPAAWGQLFEMVEQISPAMTSAVKALYADTLSPTMVAGGAKINIMPGEVTLLCDCRLLPGSTPEAKEAELKALVQGLPCEVLVEDSHPASASPTDHPIVAAIDELAPKWEPSLRLLPTLCLGGTDCRHLRWAGYPAYSYVPFPGEVPDDFHLRMHGVNERLELDVLGAVVTRYLELTRKLRA